MLDETYNPQSHIEKYKLIPITRYKFHNQNLVRRITLNDYGYYPPTFVDCPETAEEVISDQVIISLLVPTDTEDKIECEIPDNINTVWYTISIFVHVVYPRTIKI